MVMDQPAENPVSRPLQLDGRSNEPTALVLPLSDSLSSRRHSLRFADDKTDGLGVNSVNSPRIRSPILFRWNTAHEEARLA